MSEQKEKNMPEEKLPEAKLPESGAGRRHSRDRRAGRDRGRSRG